MLNKYLKIEKYNQPPLLSTSTVERAESIKPLKRISMSSADMERFTDLKKKEFFNIKVHLIS